MLSGTKVTVVVPTQMTDLAKREFEALTVVAGLHAIDLANSQACSEAVYNSKAGVMKMTLHDQSYIQT